MIRSLWSGEFIFEDLGSPVSGCTLLHRLEIEKTQTDTHTHTYTCRAHIRTQRHTPRAQYIELFLPSLVAGAQRSACQPPGICARRKCSSSWMRMKCRCRRSKHASKHRFVVGQKEREREKTERERERERVEGEKENRLRVRNTLMRKRTVGQL